MAKFNEPENPAINLISLGTDITAILNPVVISGSMDLLPEP